MANPCSLNFAKDQAQRLGGMNAGLELLLQGLLSFAGQICLGRFCRARCGSVANSLCTSVARDVVPKSIFEHKHVDLFLLDPENLSVREAAPRFLPVADRSIMVCRKSKPALTAKVP